MITFSLEKLSNIPKVVNIKSSFKLRSDSKVHASRLRVPEASRIQEGKA